MLRNSITRMCCSALLRVFGARLGCWAGQDWYPTNNIRTHCVLHHPAQLIFYLPTSTLCTFWLAELRSASPWNTNVINWLSHNFVKCSRSASQLSFTNLLDKSSAYSSMEGLSISFVLTIVVSLLPAVTGRQSLLYQVPAQQRSK